MHFPGIKGTEVIKPNGRSRAKKGTEAIKHVSKSGRSVLFARERWMRATILVLVSILCACSDRPSPVFPAASDVAYVTVSEGYTDQSGHVIRQRTRIARALELVRNRRWHAAGLEYPSPQTTVAFQAPDGHILCLLWFGPGWVGASSMLDRSQPVLLDADEDLRGELRSLFDLGAEH